jgi:Fic family protein
MKRSRPDIAGRYTDVARYVRTESGRYEFPWPAEMPALMGDLATWLGSAEDTPEKAFTAHRRLGGHPSVQRWQWTNSAAAVNLVLIRAGYPPVTVRPEDRLEYIRCLQQAQTGQVTESFYALLCRCLEAALDEYIEVMQTEKHI